jgi:serine phosphatase RsbU (regulator of sigma subunit)
LTYSQQKLEGEVLEKAAQIVAAERMLQEVRREKAEVADELEVAKKKLAVSLCDYSL